MAEQSDFNDLAAAVGLPAVKEAVNKAVAADKGIPYGAYLIKKDGVYWTPPKEDAEEVFFCSRLLPRGIARTLEGNHFALILTLTNVDRRDKLWSLPLDLVQKAGGEEARIQFGGMGGYFGPGIRARTAFPEFLQSILRYGGRNLPRVTVADRCGWMVSGEHHAFVLPGETVGTLGKEEVILTGFGEAPPDYASAGTVADWQEQIGTPCIGNSRLILAVSLPLAAPLLRPLGGEGGGFNFVGSSSIGKTTMHHVAASVAGDPAHHVKSCNGTANSFDATAALHNDGFIPYDELGTSPADRVGEIVYGLAGGIGRGRADQHGNARERKQWRILFATTAETDLATLMKSAGRRTYAGQELRLCDIPADAGQGLGIFETLHDFPTAAAFADHLKAAAARVHGTVHREYLRRLVAELNNPHKRVERLNWLNEVRQSFVAAAVPPGASGQITRAAGRFALAAAGGELGSTYGLTGWTIGTATDAALTCFNAWLDRRGTAGHGEVDQLRRQVAAFFELHGESRFSNMSSDKPRPTANRAGFRRTVDVAMTEERRTEYFVLPEVFRGELVAGFDPTWAARVLIDQGQLKPGGDGKPQSVHRLPGMGSKRCYYFPAAFDPDPDPVEIYVAPFLG